MSQLQELFRANQFLIVISCSAAIAIWLLVQALRSWYTCGQFQANDKSASSNENRNSPVRIATDWSNTAWAFDSWFDSQLRLAGCRASRHVYILIAIAISLLCGAFVFVSTDDIVLAILGALFGLGACFLGLLIIQQWRKSCVEKCLPGIVDMLALSVQSGDSLSMAVEKTAAKVHGPPKRELSLCARQLQLGLPISQAMNELCSAFSLFELNLLASVIALHHQSGGNLAHLLRRLAMILHDRFQYRRQTASARAAGIMAALIIASVGPLLIIYYVFQQEFIGGLIASPTAHVYLVVALVLEIAGLIWIFGLSRSRI